jgi:hypothetical protein
LGHAEATQEFLDDVEGSESPTSSDHERGPSNKSIFAGSNTNYGHCKTMKFLIVPDRAEASH